MLIAVVDKDQWIRDVLAANVYEVTSTGEVWRNFWGRRKPVKTHVHPKTGYRHFTMSHQNHQKCVLLHRLVALAHVPNSAGHPAVNHLDGDKQNNAVSNLEWVTASSNNKHAYDTGLRTAAGSKNGRSVLTEADVRKIRTTLGTNKELSQRFKVSARTIKNIMANDTWRHVTC